MTDVGVHHGLVAGTPTIVYGFAKRRLDDAFIALFGGSAQEVSDDVWGAPRRGARTPTADWESDSTFEDLCVFMDWQHEIYHLRHISASTFGLFMGAIANNYTLFAQHELVSWAKRLNTTGTVCRLPAFTHHGDDHSVERIHNLNLATALVIAAFRYERLDVLVTWSTLTPGDQPCFARRSRWSRLSARTPWA
jgi:hypothetical protein